MHSKRLLVAALMTVASAVQAQPARRGGPPMGLAGGGDLATLLIDARRELNLTPKQLVSLDSVERTNFAERRKAVATMRARRDSLCANRSPCELTSEERQQFVGGPTGIEKRIGERLRADSVGRTRIMGMLDTAQRRLADRLTYRQRVDRLERRFDGPSHRAMHGDRMPGFGPRYRDSRGHDGHRDWDGPREFRDSRERMMRRDGRRDEPGEAGTVPDTTGR